MRGCDDIATHLRRQLQAVAVGQADVDQHGVGTKLGDSCHRLGEAPRFAHDVVAP